MTEPTGHSTLSDTADKVIAAAVAVVGIAAVVVVVLTGHSATEVLTVISGPAAAGITGGLLARRQTKLAVKSDAIAHQTNGKLTAVLDGLQATGDKSLQILNGTASGQPE